MSDLKPCPFCGGKAQAITPANASRPYVMCVEGYCTAPKTTVEEAIAAWNRRAQEGEK